MIPFVCTGSSSTDLLKKDFRVNHYMTDLSVSERERERGAASGGLLNKHRA